jgi:hypothetical protein
VLVVPVKKKEKKKKVVEKYVRDIMTHSKLQLPVAPIIGKKEKRKLKKKNVFV